MAGAIAGTAILKYTNTSQKLRTITLTINNNCNLKCPHCYLQYDKRNYLIQESTISSIFNSEFEHIAIVGKEPLLNRASINLVESLVEKCSLKNKTISIITNGIGLINLNLKTAMLLDYIDVSLDGGPETYHIYRKGSFEKIITSINHLQEKSKIEFNALHNLNDRTIHNIDDMIRINRYANFNTIMFSPYLNTMHDGINTVSIISLELMLNKLSNSASFMEAKEALLLLDTYHLKQEGLSTIKIKELISKYKLENKIRLFEKDPIHYGIIRVTYDDFVLTPYDSINPKHYSNTSFLATNHNLNEIFAMMKESCIIT